MSNNFTLEDYKPIADSPRDAIAAGLLLLERIADSLESLEKLVDWKMDTGL